MSRRLYRLVIILIIFMLLTFIVIFLSIDRTIIDGPALYPHDVKVEEPNVTVEAAIHATETAKAFTITPSSTKTH